MDFQETADPQQALAEIWGWLNGGGPYFPGGWSIDTDGNKGEHKVSLQAVKLPGEMHKPIKSIIREVGRLTGWQIKNIRFLKDKLEFELKYYPEEERLRAEAKREEFRQEARKKREDTRPSPASSCTPEP